MVIAVIAVLMGILMPALSKARKQARGVACMARLNQWGKIWMIYCQESNNRFPSGEDTVDSINAGWKRGVWVSALRRGWEKRPQLLMCPNAVKPNPAGDHGGLEHNFTFGEYLDVVGVVQRSSYGMNLWCATTNGTAGAIQNRERTYYWQTTTSIRRPGEVPLFLDSMWRGGGPHWDADAITPPQYNGQWVGAGHEIKHFAMDRHGGGSNCLYIDGSARKIRVKELWGLKWHKSYDTGLYLRQAASWWGPWLSKM